MTTFELTYETILLDDGQVNVKIFPLSEQISKYLASYKVVVDKQDLMSNIADFMDELTPLMYAEFKSMENVPQDIRDSFTL
jgi:hypothetical protein